MAHRPYLVYGLVYTACKLHYIFKGGLFLKNATETIYGLQSVKYLLSGPLPKKFTDPCSRMMLILHCTFL